MVRTVSSDNSFIDYKAGIVGVRVRQDVCRSIILERGRWTEYGVPYAIPVEERDLEATRTGISSLAANLARVEESAEGNARQRELRNVITGKVEFHAVSSEK